MYELEDPKAEAILAADARRERQGAGAPQPGVRAVGEYAAFTYLEAHRVTVRWASSRVAITHQKTFVVDGHIAVIMTGNFTSRYYSSDRGLRRRGPNERRHGDRARLASDWAEPTRGARSGP